LWTFSGDETESESLPKTAHGVTLRILRRRQADAVLEMRQEAMHAQSGSTSQAPWVYVLTKLKTANVIRALRRCRSFAASVDFSKLCPIRQQLMSNLSCAVQFSSDPKHRSTASGDILVAIPPDAALATDGLPEQRLQAGRIAGCGCQQIVSYWQPMMS
jgi:hypothetical protein